MSEEQFAGRGLGHVKDPADPNDFQWRSLVLREAVALPPKHKVSSVGKVLDQGQTSQCVAYSSASMKMHQEFKEHKKYYNFDTNWLYNLCKQNDGIPNVDGTFIRVAMKIMQEQGYLAQAERYKLKNPTQFKIDTYVRLNSVQQIKEALYYVGPVVFGITVDTGIYSPNKAGVVPEPNNNTVGGHAMCAIGWDDNKKCQGSVGAFLVKNSWGKDYGKKGYIWLPYSHFTTYSDYDAWKNVDAKDLNT